MLSVEWERLMVPDAIGAVESVKAASDIYAPVAGVVEEINEALNDTPSLLNKKPESDGASSTLSPPPSPSLPPPPCLRSPLVHAFGPPPLRPRADHQDGSPGSS